MELVVGRDNGGRGSGVIISLVNLPSTGRRAAPMMPLATSGISHRSNYYLTVQTALRSIQPFSVLLVVNAGVSETTQSPDYAKTDPLLHGYCWVTRWVLWDVEGHVRAAYTMSSVLLGVAFGSTFYVLNRSLRKKQRACKKSGSLCCNLDKTLRRKMSSLTQL